MNSGGDLLFQSNTYPRSLVGARRTTRHTHLTQHDSVDVGAAQAACGGLERLPRRIEVALDHLCFGHLTRSAVIAHTRQDQKRIRFAKEILLLQVLRGKHHRHHCVGTIFVVANNRYRASAVVMFALVVRRQRQRERNGASSIQNNIRQLAPSITNQLAFRF
jgi:hypothetical protein